MLTDRPGRWVKRAMDVALSLAVAPLAVPMAAVVAVAIKAEDRGPVLYRGLRIGRDGAPFHILKFRTMIPDDTGPRVTRAGDRRITAIGQVLRRTKIDEIPQIVNVLRGEMSLVGPRPEDPRYVAFYTQEQREVLGVPPGVTGSAVLAYVDEQAHIEAAGPVDLERFYLEQLLPAKLAMELEYVRQWSLLEDVRILMRTAGRVFP